MPSTNSRHLKAESRLINRNVSGANGRTSMRLEPEIWEALREICLREDKDLGELIQSIEKGASNVQRTSAVRVYVLTYFRNAANDGGSAALAKLAA